MIYIKGNATTLLEVAQAFEAFCQTSNASTDAWELMQSNLDSLYGTTFRVKGIDSDSYAYISICYQAIVHMSTYYNWFNSDYNYLSEDSTHSASSLYGTTVDIFESSGYFMAFNVHKQYSPNLYMCEQGGAYKPKVSDYNLLNFMASNKFEDPAMYPNFGGPVLCNIDSDIDSSYGIVYYFVRTNNSATITISNGKVFQSISFGLMDGIDTITYKFPAYICGGSNCISPNIWIYTPVGSSYPTYQAGNTFNLSMEHIGLSNNICLYPCKVNNAKSNFLVMRADGQWDEYYNLTQAAEVKGFASYGSNTYAWGNVLGEPSFSDNNNCIFPTKNDCSDIVATQSGNSIIHQVMPCSNDNSGIAGFIPNNYMIMSDNIKYGIQTINNVKYLIIPSGWKDRVWYYQTNMAIDNTWTLPALKEKYENETSVTFCSLAIKIEE